MSPCCENEELEVEDVEGERQLVCQGCGCIHGVDGVIENQEAEEMEGEVME